MPTWAGLKLACTGPELSLLTVIPYRALVYESPAGISTDDCHSGIINNMGSFVVYSGCGLSLKLGGGGLYGVGKSLPAPTWIVMVPVAEFQLLLYALYSNESSPTKSGSGK